MPTKTVTYHGPPTFDRRGRDIESIVSLEEAQELLSEPIPVAFIAADGTVLACNALAAWLCNVPAASGFVLQNVHEYSAAFILSERIPLACNHAFRRRKLGALHEADPRREWQAHRQLRQAVGAAERRYTRKSCPVENCVQIAIRDDSWQYSLCIQEPDSWPASAPEHLLQFRVTDSLIGLASAPMDIPKADQRFLVVFEPGNEHTFGILRQKLQDFNRDSHHHAYIAPHLDGNGLIKYLEMCVKNSVKCITEYIEDTGLMNENIPETQSPLDIAPTPEVDGPEQVGTVLRRLRARRQMSSEELAKHLGVSRGAVGHWELGRRTPPRDLRLVRALFDALDPSGGEREQLLKLILGTEVVMEEAAESDEAFYEDMLRRTDLIMRLGAQVVALQAELEREATFVRSALQDRLWRSHQRAIQDEPELSGDSVGDAFLTPKPKAGN